MVEAWTRLVKEADTQRTQGEETGKHAGVV
jgi:hypothetical protein